MIAFPGGHCAINAGTFCSYCHHTGPSVKIRVQRLSWFS